MWWDVVAGMVRGAAGLWLLMVLEEARVSTVCPVSRCVTPQADASRWAAIVVCACVSTCVHVCVRVRAFVYVCAGVAMRMFFYVSMCASVTVQPRVFSDSFQWKAASVCPAPLTSLCLAPLCEGTR